MPGPNLLTDGGFEAWTNPTTPTYWTKFLTGTSTLNQDTTEKHDGASSARGDVDASNGWAEGYQAKPVKPSTWYRANFWYKTGAGKTVAGFCRLTVGGVSKYLQNDGTWQSYGAPYDYDYSGGLESTTWARHAFTFKTPAVADSFSMRWGFFNLSAASSSFWVDDVYLEELGPAAYADLVADPAAERDFLLTIRPKELLRVWTKTGGYSYTYEKAWSSLPSMGDFGTTYRSFQAVKQNGTSLAARASVALVDANAGSYYFDEANSKLYVHLTDDGAADRESVFLVAFFKLFFSSGLGKGGQGKVFNDIYHEPLLATSALPAITSEQSDFITGGGLSVGDMAFELSNNRRFFDKVWTTWSWKNAEVELRFGGESLPYSEYALIYSGFVKDEVWLSDRVRFETVNYLSLLQRQVPVNPLFGAEVADAARGRPLPLCIGKVSGISPLCSKKTPADGTEWTVADSDYQTLKDIKVVYDGATDVTAYVTKDLANCKFTFNSYTPAGEVTCDVEGAKISDIPGESSTDLMTNASDIVRFFLLKVLGLSSGQLDTASFSAARDALDMYPLCRYIRNRRNLSSYVNEVERSVMAILYQRNDGKFAFDAFEPLFVQDETLETQEIASFEQAAPSEKLYAGVQVYYNPKPLERADLTQATEGEDDTYDVVTGESARSIYVEEQTSGYKRVFSWLKEQSGAEVLKERFLFLTSVPVAQLLLRTNGVKLFNLKPGDILKVNKSVAPTETGSLVDQYYRIIRLTKEIAAGQAEALVDNFQGLTCLVGTWASDSAPDWASASTEERDTLGFWADDEGCIVPGDWSTYNKSLWW